MLTALTDITGDFNHAISEMGKVLKVHGRVIPAANKKINLHAELEDGSIIEGESKIPKAKKRINRVFLVPENVQPLPEAIRAINRADYILIGPGSLYTSIIPNLLVKAIGEAVVKAKGRKIYVCNLMTQKGETISYTAGDHVEALFKHVGDSFIDSILVNDVKLPHPVKELYKEECAEPVTFDVAKLESMGLEVIKRDIATIRPDGTVRHNATNVAKWLVDYANIYEQEVSEL